ncbi:Gfo/Idh/MocA family oxidoreductase [Opitutales bacterium ASA1]|uniref:NAD(P)H-dependent oxidoreductase n=1 Tax=Congregicoccus parvus TaxID=3081749 RepID=UPI002B286669|nr:Gfo/Idh/MocA family oxidoreductase [Opitutales bacterium ASA1]
MVIVDTALAKRAAEGNPVRVALIGAGYMGRGVALQIISSFPGMRLVAVSNRTVSEAERAYREAGVTDAREVTTLAQLDESIAAGIPAFTSDAHLLCQAQGVEAVIEATGEIEFGAHVVLRAIEHRKHIVLMNAELDATVGPILKVYADRAGIILTNADGDQPGVVMNLLRFVKSIGCKPLLAGNIKGLQDRFRNPTTQAGFAAKYNQKPKLITAFADGTKISMEMAITANATGFRVNTRGMHGYKCAHVTEALKLFTMDHFAGGGIVDYVLGAEPGPGVFVLGYDDNPIKRQYMNYFKMGDGPLYVFYVPYHLPHLETPLTVARAVLFGDAAVAPLGGPVCDVITMAKRELKAGETLDGIGAYMTYGTIENSDVCQRDRLLPMGLSEGCVLKRDIAVDEAIGYDDIVLPEGRLADRLRAEQTKFFAP